nr:hypothetical protein [uncultured Roseateles sp.]
MGGGNLVVNDADAQCAGSVKLKTQYGAQLNLPYSVERYSYAVVKSQHSKRNPRDGAMLWSILKTAKASCGSAMLASPGTIGKRVAEIFGPANDPVLQPAEWK